MNVNYIVNHDYHCMINCIKNKKCYSLRYLIIIVMKKNILIVISSDEYINNYVTTKSFSEIEKKYNCSYLISKKVNRLNLISKYFKIKTYSFDEDLKNRHINFMNLLCFKYKKKSSSFYLRLKKFEHLYNVQFKRITSSHKLGKKIRANIFFWIKKKLLFIFKTIVCSNLIFPFYSSKKISELNIDIEFEKKFLSFSPDLALFPSSAYDPEGFDIIRICKKMNIPSIFLVDNWDNLSSKTILWQRPSVIGVWGQQSLNHAVNIQGFKKNQVNIIGTPRFNHYYKLRNKNLKSYFDGDYVLFLGSTLPFDEASVLRKLNKIIDKKSNIFKNLKIIYRPHPFRQGNDTIIGENLKNVIIDPQILESYKSLKKNILPNLNYFPSLIKNAKFVIGGLTSMIIETLIFRKKYIALVHSEKNNISSPHNVYKNYIHFSELKYCKEISFCNNLDKLEEIFTHTWLNSKTFDKMKLDLSTNFFCYSDNKDYSHRLKNLCVNTLSKN